MTQPKILCISLGSIGKRHLRNTRALLPDAEIAVWRQHTQSDAEIPEGADKMLGSMNEALAFAPDAVIISSPASEHIKNATAFVERGVPLFIEKPLAVHAAEACDFVKQCKAAKGFVMVGYVLRFLPALHAIKKLIDTEELGQVYTAHIQVGQYLPDWRPDADYRQGVSAQACLGGGALLELSHEIDYATWLFGWPNTLQCQAQRLSQLEIDVEDSAQLLLNYGNKHVTVQLDFLQRVANMAVQIVAEKATLKADLIKEEITLFSAEHPEGAAVKCDKLPNGNDIYLRQFDFFFQKALKNYKATYPEYKGFQDWASVDHSAGVLTLVDVAKKASDTGHRQTLGNII